MTTNYWPNLMTKEAFDRLPRKAANPKFDAWMAKVDQAIAKKAYGLTSSDLPDWDYMSAFEDGTSPGAAAAAAIRAA